MNMTPKDLNDIRMRTKLGLGALVYDDRRALLLEVDRLNAELAEARLSAEEAWAANDEKETR